MDPTPLLNLVAAQGLPGAIIVLLILACVKLFKWGEAGRRDHLADAKAWQEDYRKLAEAVTLMRPLLEDIRNDGRRGSR